MLQGYFIAASKLDDLPWIEDLLDIFHYMLQTNTRMRESYGPIYIQTARRELTAKEMRAHLRSFDKFLKCSIIRVTTSSKYANKATYATYNPTSKKITIMRSLVEAVDELRYPALLLIFL